MSSTNSHIYTHTYNSYGEALSSYLKDEFGRGGKKKLAKMLAEDPENKKKVHNQQVNIGRWTHKDPGERREPLDQYKKKIHKSLNICISQNKLGKWGISRTKPNQTNDPEVGYSIDELLKEERSRLGIRDIPDTERGRELQGMLDDAVSLVLKIRRSIELEKRRSGA